MTEGIFEPHTKGIELSGKFAIHYKVRHLERKGVIFLLGAKKRCSD